MSDKDDALHVRLDRVEEGMAELRALVGEVMKRYGAPAQQPTQEG